MFIMTAAPRRASYTTGEFVPRSMDVKEPAILTSQAMLIFLTDRRAADTRTWVGQQVGHNGSGGESYRAHRDEHVDDVVRHERV